MELDQNSLGGMYGALSLGLLEQDELDGLEFFEDDDDVRKAYQNEYRKKLYKTSQYTRDCHSAAGRKRRAIKHKAPGRGVTAGQWNAIVEAYDHKCAYCGKRYESIAQEHVMPLSVGGSHDVSNVVPSCSVCNSKKGAKTPGEANMEMEIYINPKNIHGIY